MAKESSIEWTDATVNFWQGCHKVSPGCAHCYMFTDKKRYGQEPNVVTRCKDATFYAALKWKEPKRIFTCSWSDFFIEEADEWRADAWNVIRMTPQHTWQILTKRTERMRACLPDDWGQGWANVWLGVSVENQKIADARREHLKAIPAITRFVSYEPALGPVNWAGWEFVNQIISGGESGPNARPSHPEWHRTTRNFCQMNGIAYFFKQWGEWLPNDHAQAAGITEPFKGAVGGKDWEFPLSAWHVGKKAAGRLLDNRTWSEFPKVATA